MQLRNDYEADFRDIINQGKKKGYFQDIDTEIILFSLLSTLRWLHLWYARNQEVDPAILELQLRRVLLEGIKSN